MDKWSPTSWSADATRSELEIFCERHAEFYTSKGIPLDPTAKMLVNIFGLMMEREHDGDEIAILKDVAEMLAEKKAVCCCFGDDAHDWLVAQIPEKQ